MPRVLFLTQVLPYPLDAGPKVRAYHMLRHLAQTHEVTLVSFVRPDDQAPAVEHLKQICHEVHPVPIKRSLWYNARAAIKGLSTGLPMVIARDEMPEMISLLQRLTRERRFDVIHADQTSMAGYGQMAARIGDSHTVLDQHNAIHVLAHRMAAQERQPLRKMIMQREARAFARFEADMCQLYDAIFTVTPEDQEHLLSLHPPFQQTTLYRKFSVIPISVDPAHTPPVEHHSGGSPTILHLGTMFWPPNVEGVLWFAQQVLPLIHRQTPEAKLVIIGKNPPPQVQVLAEDPRIQVMGYVQNPIPYLQAADAFIVPLHAGSGMRVKILNGWLWGLPIISTTIGAEGIETRPGQNILLADSPANFAQAVLRVLDAPALNQRLRQQGRAWVEAKYSTDAIYQQVDEVYNHLLNPIN